jgi:UDP-N-acetyl-D-glucosamine dehydrogenase
MKKPTIAIAGLGYVGLPLALLVKKRGYNVLGIDINKQKVDKINRGISPFKDSYLQHELTNYPIKATTSFSKLSDASVIIICVPTPVLPSKLPDYRHIISVCSNIAPHLKTEQLVVLESTVNPGVSEEIILPILESGSNRKCGKDFSLAHCPERINPGDIDWRVDNISRVVGGFDKKSLDKALEFYRSIIEADVKPMFSLKEAEAVKIVENSFRNINIAFVNELAKSFSKLGIDVVNVINGASTKPFSFMPHFPGCGIGGHCIPLDPYYLIDYADKHGFNHELIKLSCQINESMPFYTISLLEEALESIDLKLSNSTIAVLGLSYKENVDDIRESPSLEIINDINKRGGTVRIFDPHVPNKSTVKSLSLALKNAQAAVITVAHTKLVQEISPEIFLKNNIKIVIDGRNCLDKEPYQKAGIIYHGIGR